jgi:hypothetical protein
MAAVIVPSPQPRPALGSAPRPVARPHGRPVLRVIPGGRSADAMAATYRRRRLVAGLLLVTVLALGWVAIDAAAGAAARLAAPQSAPIEGPTVVVEAGPGDTLWTLAREVHPSGDVRPAVEAMIAERGGSAVQVGDEVRVPAG